MTEETRSRPLPPVPLPRPDRAAEDAACRGADLLHDPRRNKGTAFTLEERDALGLRGILPPRVCTIEEQVVRVRGHVHHSSSDLQRYTVLASLQERNETLFYRVLFDHLEEMMPIVYTPTVGEACQRFGQIFRRSHGLFVSIEDRGRIAEVLRNWRDRESVRVIVVTDGERILGLGDLGANGMGIPIGKLSLYTACAGVDPRACLPIALDVGTNNEQLLHDPLYVGLARPRVTGAEYDDFLEEFVVAVQEVFASPLVQFEDFANHNAFRLLERYRDRMCCFNDDIQGTAAVAFGGVLASLRLSGMELGEHRFLFLGAGEAGIGIANLIVADLVAGGIAEAEARRRCWFVDSRGLVVDSRTDLNEHKRRFAQPHAPVGDLLSAVRAVRPTALIGVSGQAQTFTQPVIEAIAEGGDRPLVFALSNPTSKAECTAVQAYEWSRGRVIFASGSPFAPVEIGGRRFVPGQGNNAYIFPGVGLGVMVSGARRVTDEMFLEAARELARQTADGDLETGCLYPPLSRIREVSARIAVRVADVAWTRGLASTERPEDVPALVRSHMYEPHY